MSWGSGSTSYKVPEITGIANAGALKTAGGEQIVLSGNDFGPSGTNVTVEYRSTTDTYVAVNCFVSTAHTGVTCTSVPGVGTALQWRITIARQSSDWYQPDAAISSYAPPSIASLSGQLLLHTGGNEVVMVTGENFGYVDGVEITYGKTGEEYSANCSYTTPHRQFRCLSAPGVGANHKWMVTVRSQFGVSTSTTSYRPPSISRVYGPGSREGSTEGNEKVFIRGDNLGRNPDLKTKLKVIYGDLQNKRDGVVYTAKNCDMSVPDIELVCLTVEGVGVNHTWRVILDEQLSNISDNTTSYHPPVISYFSGPGSNDSDTRGDERVHIHGRNFGRVLGPDDTVTYGPTGTEFVASNCNITVYHREVSCDTVEGVGDGLIWSLVVATQPSESPTTNYGLPEVLWFDGPAARNAGSDGSELIILHGRNFGPPLGLGVDERNHSMYLERVVYGPNGDDYEAEGCEVKSHTEMYCWTIPGTGSSLRWTLTVGGQQGEPSLNTSSYAPPMISSISPATYGTEGGVVVTLNGTDFGLLDPQTSVVVDFDGMILLPLGMGEGDQAMNNTERLLMEEEEEDEEEGGELPVGLVTGPVNTWHAVQFQLPNYFGHDKPVRLVLSSPAGTFYSSSILFSYNAPAIVPGGLVLIESSIENKDYRYELTILGENFGNSSSLVNGWVEIEGEPMGRVLSWSHTMIRVCTELDTGSVVVHVASRHSNSERYELLNPSLSARTMAELETRLFHTQGGETLTILGAEFGEVDITVTINDIDCPLVAPVTSSMVNGSRLYNVSCSVPEGQGVDNRVRVYRGGTSGLSSFDDARLRYYPPSVSSVKDGNGDTISYVEDGVVRFSVPTGGGKVVFQGQDFGLNGFFSLPYFVLTCGESTWSHSSVECIVPAGEGRSIGVDVDIAGQSLTHLLFLDYQLPSVSAIVGADMSFGEFILRGPTRGGQKLSFSGSNFGSSSTIIMSAGGMKVEIGGKECEPVTLNYDHSNYECFTPEGQGTGHAMVMTVGQQSVVLQWTYSYYEPKIYDVSPPAGTTAGGVEVVVSGEDFGLNGMLKIFGAHVSGGVIGIPTSQALVHNHTHFVFSSLPSQGGPYRVQLDVGGQNSSELLSYDHLPPRVTLVDPILGHCLGNDLIEIHGDSFGVHSPPDLRYVSVGIGGRPCQRVNNTALPEGSTSHTYIACQTPPGLGANLSLIVTVDTRSTSKVSIPVRWSYFPPEVSGGACL